MWRSEEADDFLRLEYGKGRYSAVSIAKKFGVTKGMVINEARKLGLAKVTGRRRREPSAFSAAPRDVALLPSLAPEPILPIVTPRSPQRAARKNQPPARAASAWSPWKTCQWIDGDDASGPRCGCPTMAGRSWCPDHYARVFLRLPKDLDAA